MRSKVLRLGGVLLIGLALVWPVPQSFYNRLTLALSDFMHFPLAMLVFWLMAGLVSSRRLAAVMIIAASITIELIQPAVGRSASFIDFAYALLGVFAVMLLYRTPRRKLLFMLICLMALFPVGSVVWDQCAMRRDFPLLAGFESPLEAGRWTLNGMSIRRVVSHSTQGRFSAEVSVSESGFDYPGLFLEDMPRDWRQIAALEFAVFWPENAPRELCIRMDDKNNNPAYRNRFQKSFVLNPGMNRIRIDREEFGTASGGVPLDLSHVTRMGLFYLAAEKGEIFYLDDVRLLKDKE